jgi:UDP-MurNAc hydroxylase
MWLLRRIVDSKIGWEEALLSMRIKLRRDPDVFDVRLLGLLRYGSRPAQTRQMLVDAAASDEMIERDGLRCQKYCPHAGEDLTNAIVADGVVECPRHHWKWDTTTGECIAGGSLPLRVERIEDAR